MTEPILIKTIIQVSELIKTKSSNVDTVAYDAESETAFITFKNGTLYKYEGVSSEEFDALKNAESVGSYLGRVFLKKGFGYEKLEKTELNLGTLTPEVIEEAAKKVAEEALTVAGDDYEKV